MSSSLQWFISRNFYYSNNGSQIEPELYNDPDNAWEAVFIILQHGDMNKNNSRSSTLGTTKSKAITFAHHSCIFIYSTKKKVLKQSKTSGRGSHNRFYYYK